MESQPANARMVSLVIHVLYGVDVRTLRVSLLAAGTVSGVTPAVAQARRQRMAASRWKCLSP